MKSSMQEKAKRIWKHIKADLYANRSPILMIGGYLILAQLLFHATCFSVVFWGVPCPGCGLTRAGLSLLRGDLQAAIRYNASIFLWLFLILYYFVFHYLLERKATGIYVILVITCIVTMGLFGYRIYTHTLVEVTYPGLINLASRLLR